MKLIVTTLVSISIVAAISGWIFFGEGITIAS